jgi:hypothetical protein
MQPVSVKEVRDLEDQAAYLKGEKARTLKEEVEIILARAEATHADPELIDRLDTLLLSVTAASRDVCTNTRCPHYNTKCKMR